MQIIKPRSTKLTKSKRKFEIDRLLSAGLRPAEIQEKLHISRITYWRDVKELQSDLYSEESLAQHDQEINARWNKLDRIITLDLEKTSDDPEKRARVLTNAIKINKEKLDYFLKTGKIKETPKQSEIKIDVKATTLNELSLINKYLVDELDKTKAINGDENK